MSRLLDPSFKYVNAASTDVGKTIKRELERLRKLKADAVLSRQVVPFAGKVRK